MIIHYKIPESVYNKKLIFYLDSLPLLENFAQKKFCWEIRIFQLRTLKLNNESDNPEENDSKKPKEKSNTSLVLLNETDETNKKERYS